MNSDNEEPPPPTTLREIQERQQAHQRWCAEMLAASINDQAAVWQQLLEARQRREAAITRMRVAKCLLEAAAALANKYQHQLNTVIEICSEIIRQLDAEIRWRPASVTMSQRHQQELRERVARLQAFLAAKTRPGRVLKYR